METRSTIRGHGGRDRSNEREKNFSHFSHRRSLLSARKYGHSAGEGEERLTPNLYDWSKGDSSHEQRERLSLSLCREARNGRDGISYLCARGTHPGGRQKQDNHRKRPKDKNGRLTKDEIVTRGSAHPHTGDLTICRRAFSRPAYRQVEERKEIENVSESCIETVVIDRVVVPDFV